MNGAPGRSDEADAPRADDRARMRVLIVKASSMGDIVLTLPMLKTLRHAYPRAYLAWIVESPFQDLLHGNPDLDRVFVVDTSGLGRMVSTGWQTLRDIRAEAFDVVVDVQGWIKSQVLCLLSGARVRTGLRKPNELGFHLLRRGVPFRPGVHMTDLCLDVARSLGATDARIAFDLPVSDADRDYVDRFLASHSLGPDSAIAVLQPGTTWKSKRWSAAKLAEVGRTLAERGRWAPVVLRGPDNEPDASAVVRLIGARGVLGPPTTIRQLVALIERSRLYVGTDSGPMHIASALGVPTVGLFGPSDASRFAPYREQAAVVRSTVSCSPCGVPTCRYGTVACMASIEVSEVLDAIGRLGAAQAADA